MKKKKKEAKKKSRRRPVFRFAVAQFHAPSNRRKKNIKKGMERRNTNERAENSEDNGDYRQNMAAGPAMCRVIVHILVLVGTPGGVGGGRISGDVLLDISVSPFFFCCC